MNGAFAVFLPPRRIQAEVVLPTTKVYQPPNATSRHVSPVREGVWLSILAAGQVARSRRRKARLPACSAVPKGLVAGFYARAPGKSYKWVYFIRHSEALVNAAGRVFPKDDPRKKAVRMDMKYLDSPLSEKGLAEAKGMRAKAPQVDLVVASPLTRALQTATAVFGCDTDGPPLVALEELREFCGKQFQPCDSRRAPQELQLEFPHVDFSHVPPGGDSLLGPNKVESVESVDQRIYRFFEWLRISEHQNIGCIAHFQILTRIFENLQAAGLDCAAYGDFKNLEVRSIPIAFD